MFGHFEIVTPIHPNPNHHSSDVAMWGRNHPLIKYHEELEAGNDEVFVSILFGYAFEFPGVDDSALVSDNGERVR